MSEALGSLGTEQSNKLLDLPAESDLPCFSPGSMPGFSVSRCRKGSVSFSFSQGLEFHRNCDFFKWSQIPLPVDEVAQPFYYIFICVWFCQTVTTFAKISCSSELSPLKFSGNQLITKSLMILYFEAETSHPARARL